MIDTSALGTGITLTAPLTKAHADGSTVNGSATGLISDSPQGQIIGVLNNDQDGLNYPAHKWGTGYYMSNLLDGQAGPWFNNINATPVSRGAEQRLRHGRDPAAPAQPAGGAGVPRLGGRRGHAGAAGPGRRSTTSASRWRTRSSSRTRARCRTRPGIHSVPAYLPADQAQYTPVLDDRTGRTDQVSFGVRGIPSLGDIGQYDSSTDPLVGGADNPYPSYYPSKPTLAGEFGQDSSSDYFSNLNYWASGTVHGPGGFDKPSEGLLRGVEFIATWFSYAIASPQEGGAVSQAEPPGRVLRDDAEEADRADDGHLRRRLTAGRRAATTDDLTYYWDFGDGSPMVKTDNPLIQHTFPTQAAWRDVKLLVAGAGQWNDPAKFALVPAGRADRLLPDVLPGARTADRAAAAHDRLGGRSVRCADRARAGRVDRGGSRREAGRGREPDAGGHRERRADERRLEERRRGIAVSETPS